MVTKPIFSILTLATLVASSLAADEPDFDNPQALERVVGEAIIRGTLEERGPAGAKVFHLPESDIP